MNKGRTLRHVAALLLGLAAAFAMPGAAKAGGYDTPMLYTARHMGMGGTAVASVDGPSALFHNPAGLMGTDHITLIGDLSLLIGDIEGNPTGGGTDSVTSNTTIAPFFLAGGSYRITEWLAAGFAVYPVASAGATYEYNGIGDAVGTDETALLFLELSPGIAFSIPGTGLSIGAGYRMTYVNLTRERTGFNNVIREASLPLSGWSFLGFRVGLQYNLMDYVRFGFHYRHKTKTDVEGRGNVVMSPDADLTGSFTLPSRFSFGARSDFYSFGVAFDAEYALQSQNPRGQISGPVLPVTQVSDWSDAWTLRVGAEYRLMDGKLPLRLGYVWDQQTSNKTYPSAFGTPPAPTHVFTVGAGWNQGPWQVNVAYAYRTGSTTVTPMDIDGRDSCLSCGDAGDYAIGLNGIYVDFSYHFGRDETYETGHGVGYRQDDEVGAITDPEAVPEEDSGYEWTNDEEPTQEATETAGSEDDGALPEDDPSWHLNEESGADPVAQPVAEEGEAPAAEAGE